MTEPQGGADPEGVHHQRGPRRRRVGHQRREVVLVLRVDRLVPDRDGGDRSRRLRPMSAIRCSWCPPRHPASTCCATSVSATSRWAAVREGYVRYENVRVPADHMLGPRGGAFVVAQTRLGGGRIHHAMRTVGLVRRIFDMICERAVSRHTQGEMLGNKQLVQEMVADSWMEIEAFRLLTLADRVEDRPAQRLQGGSGRHLGGEGDDAEGAARRVGPGAAAPRFAWDDPRDALRAVPRRVVRPRAWPTARPRCTRSRWPGSCSRTARRHPTCSPPSTCSDCAPRPRPSSPTSSPASSERELARASSPARVEQLRADVDAIASRFGSGVCRRRLCLTISDHVAADLNQASARNHSEFGDLAPQAPPRRSTPARSTGGVAADVAGRRAGRSPDRR